MNRTAIDWSARGSFSPWCWLVAPAVALLGAPLWLHWWEPGQFIGLNQALALLPAGVWTGLSLLGNAWAVLGVTAPLLVLAPRLLWAWLCAAPFAIVFARTGKAWIESPRPAAVLDNTWFHIVGEPLHNVSMPSGHTLTAFAVASGIYFALPRLRRWRHGWLWLLALATGLSRVAVGAHWPGDVAVGAALGILSGMLGQYLLVRLPTQWVLPRSTALRVVAALMALAAYNLVVEALDFAENQLVQDALAVVIVLALAVFVPRTLKRGGGG